MTEKRRARFESLRESSKERIEQAALELFAKKGYGNTSISQIAKAAGISKGLMYNYYEGKEALLGAIVEKSFEWGREMFSAGVAQTEKPEDLLRYVVEASVAAVLEQPDFWKLMTSLAFQEEVLQAMAPEIEELRKQNIALGKEIFTALGYPNPVEQALLFAASIDGMFFHYILSDGDYPLEGVKNLLIEKFCHPHEE
ncbi:MAG: TetR/AcrR family transcriptional regulator [Saprospiraceae bacterium]